MKDVLWVGLQLTFYGTGLVFLVLAFLWGLMSLLLRLDAGEESAAEVPSRPPAAGERAALTPTEQTAVLLAVLAHTGRLIAEEHEPLRMGSETSTPWVIVGRERQLHRGVWRRR